MKNKPPFYKYFSTSESNYEFSSTGKISKKDSNPQSSCNVPKKFYNYAFKDNNILKIKGTHEFCSNTKWTEEEVYELNEGYELEFGQNMLWLIGNEYGNKENKFFFSRRKTLTTCEENYNGTILNENEKNEKAFRKPEIYKTLYDEDSWFIKFMEKNLPETRLIFDIKDNRLILDIEFNTNKKFDDDTEFSHNRIVFGAPGTGKSYKLNMEKEFFNGRFERVTFHPNYSYSQFVGTYKPVPEFDKGKPTGNITYDYIPGPFMRAYIEAYKEPDKPYLLLIEEINRANATAVFGDVFQLLDRKNGESEFEIETSEDIRKYFYKKLDEIKNENFDCKRMKIPENMYIWATMNSADQGVFPMDTAFKRRLYFEYICINDSVSENYKNYCAKFPDYDKPINWDKLRRRINEKLSNCNVNEDKLLGPYFISKDILDMMNEENCDIDNEFMKAFKSKILMYLFEDAGKHCDRLFEGFDGRPTFSEILDKFDKDGLKIFGDDFPDNLSE